MINDINRFIQLADTNNLKTKEIATQITNNNKEIIGNFHVTVSFGAGVVANIPWFSISRNPGYKEDGPVFLYYKNKRKLILSFGVKEETTTWDNQRIDSKYDFKWNDGIRRSYRTVQDFFGERVERYGDSYVFKTYDVADSMVAEGDTINSDIVEMLSTYKNQLPDSSLIRFIKSHYEEHFNKFSVVIANERQAFLNAFPINQITNISLDDYSMNGNKESFTNYIENKTPNVCSGNLGINQNKLFYPKGDGYGVLGPVERAYQGFNTVEDKFDEFKRELYHFISNFDINTYSTMNVLNFKSNVIKFKLLRLYRPEMKIYGLPSLPEVTKILKKLNLSLGNRNDESIDRSIILTNYLLTEFPEIVELNTDVVNHLIWDYKVEYIDSADSSEELNEEDQPEREEKMEKYPDKNLILYGPPGTGKTYNSKIYAVAICDDLDLDEVKNQTYDVVLKRYEELVLENRVKFTTFHQSYGYEEFIEGIFPEINEKDQVTYKTNDGIFKDFCGESEKSNEPSVFIIDEINRGNISKIFGELITLIEDTKRKGEKEAMSVILPYSKKTFTVPNNVYILGTMNTADRSIALMDTALRRRFAFEEMMPEPELIDLEVDGLKISEMLTTINKRIEVLYDREHTIGHAFFMEKELTLDKLSYIFKNKIIPLLQEYFYEDYEKIQWVLGDNDKTDESFKFITQIKNEANVFKGKNGADMNALPEYRYEINKDAFDKIESYKEIK